MSRARLSSSGSVYQLRSIVQMGEDINKKREFRGIYTKILTLGYLKGTCLDNNSDGRKNKD